MKPDYLDLDKDGNKKEPMKMAAKQMKRSKMQMGGAASKNMMKPQTPMMGGMGMPSQTPMQGSTVRPAGMMYGGMAKKKMMYGGKAKGMKQYAYGGGVRKVRG